MCRALLCHVLGVSSVVEEEVVEGDVAQSGHGRYGSDRRIGRWPW